MTLPGGEATGSFTDTLENAAVTQTFTYNNSGTITLHDMATALEPSGQAALGIGVLGLGALALKARNRTASSAA